MKTRTEALNMRMTPETAKQLKDLCDIWGLSKTKTIERLIYGEWLKSTEIGKEKIQEALDTFGVFQKQIEALTDGK